MECLESATVELLQKIRKTLNDNTLEQKVAQADKENTDFD